MKYIRCVLKTSETDHLYTSIQYPGILHDDVGFRGGVLVYHPLGTATSSHHRTDDIASCSDGRFFNDYLSKGESTTFLSI
jgi:hypothetical protein